MEAGKGQNPAILGFPKPCRPAGAEGVEIREPFVRPFAPCFDELPASPHNLHARAL
jgi:hypothetical protein